MPVAGERRMFLTPTGASAALWSVRRWFFDRSAARRRETSRYVTEAPPNCSHTAPHQTAEQDASAARRSDRFGIGNAVSGIVIVPLDCRLVKLLTGKSLVPLPPWPKRRVLRGGLSMNATHF